MTVADQVLNLTPTEYRLLAVLAARPAEVVARHELAERVWGFVDEGVIRSLDVHMRRLRAKITGAAAHGPSLITRRGFAFQLVDEPNPAAPLAASSDARDAPRKLAAPR